MAVKKKFVLRPGVVVRLLKSFKSHQRAYFNKKNQEALHQMRVVARKLRNALWAYSFLWPDRDYKVYKKQIAHFSHLLSPLRDRDVQIIFLKSVLKNKDTPKEFHGHIRQWIQKKLDQKVKWQKDVKRGIGRLQKEKTLEMVRQICKVQGQWDTRTKNVIKKKIKKRFKRIFVLKKYAYRPHAVDRLHQIRIANKNLRYTLESYCALNPCLIKKVLNPMSRIHHLLGSLHDYDLWIIEFSKKGKSDHEQKACIFFVKQCRSLRQGVYQKFKRVFKNTEKEIFPQIDLFFG